MKNFLKDPYSLYHYANDVKLLFRKQYDIKEKENEFKLKIQEGKFLNKNDEEKAQQELKTELDNLSKITNNICKLENKSAKNPLYNKVFNIIKEDFQKKDIKSNTPEITQQNVIKTTSTPIKKNNANTIQEKSIKKKKYKAQELSKYNKREQKLITRIYSKIKELLPKDMAEDLIDKIQEDLKSE